MPQRRALITDDFGQFAATGQPRIEVQLGQQFIGAKTINRTDGHTFQHRELIESLDGSPKIKFTSGR